MQCTFCLDTLLCWHSRKKTQKFISSQTPRAATKTQKKARHMRTMGATICTVFPKCAPLVTSPEDLHLLTTLAYVFLNRSEQEAAQPPVPIIVSSSAWFLGSVVHVLPQSALLIARTSALLRHVKSFELLGT